MKKTTILLAALLILATSAQAATLKGDYPACISEDLFDQLLTAATQNDERGFQYLLQNGCIITRAGTEVSVLDTSWTGRSKVRAYAGDTTVILWTNSENIQQ